MEGFWETLSSVVSFWDSAADSTAGVGTAAGG